MRSSFSLASGRTAALDTHAHGRPDAGDSSPDGRPSLPTVLLVPGYTGSKEDFLPLMRPLAEAGFRAVAIDQRGQYESSWAESAEGYRISALAADVVELGDILRAESRDSAVHLIGHSFGGLVSRAAVLSRTSLFASLTLMGSGPAAIGGARLQAMQAAEPVLAEHGMERLWDHIAEQSRADPKFRQSPPALLRFLRERFLANDPVGLRVMGEELQSHPDLTADLAAAGLPMLVVHGVADDAWLPALQQRMAAQLQAEYLVVADAAHSPAVENPAGTLEALLPFLSAVPARR